MYIYLNAMCGVFLPLTDFKHDLLNGCTAKTFTRCLKKTDICEAEIRRNLTFSIKVSFCSAQGGGTRLRSRVEGEEDLEPGGGWGGRRGTLKN